MRIYALSGVLWSVESVWINLTVCECGRGCRRPASQRQTTTTTTLEPKNFVEGEYIGYQTKFIFRNFTSHKWKQETNKHGKGGKCFAEFVQATFSPFGGEGVHTTMNRLMLPFLFPPFFIFRKIRCWIPFVVLFFFYFLSFRLFAVREEYLLLHFPRSQFGLTVNLKFAFF